MAALGSQPSSCIRPPRRSSTRPRTRTGAAAAAPPATSSRPPRAPPRPSPRSSPTSRAAQGELLATNQYIQSLHNECDWLIQYFDVRKDARASEVDALEKAKAVLSGADYSLVQTKTQKFLQSA